MPVSARATNISARATKISAWATKKPAWDTETSAWDAEVSAWEANVSTWEAKVSAWEAKVLTVEAEISARATNISVWVAEAATHRLASKAITIMSRCSNNAAKQTGNSTQCNSVSAHRSRAYYAFYILSHKEVMLLYEYTYSLLHYRFK